MTNDNHVDSRELGLAIGAILGRHLFKADHLHYGLWTDGLEVDISNMKQAQDNYARMLLDAIPEGVRTILDVGCGIGAFTRMLQDEGYEVEGVLPSDFLSRMARQRLVPGTVIHQCRFEDLVTDKHFDLVLFSESFQYIDLKSWMKKTRGLLNKGGHVIISDFFRRGRLSDFSMGGGHKLVKFQDQLAGADFEILRDEEITDLVAPTLDLANDLYLNVGLPIWELVAYYIETNYPRSAWIADRLFGKKIEAKKQKYFSGERSAENFKKHKSYRLYLLRAPGATG